MQSALKRKHVCLILQLREQSITGDNLISTTSSSDAPICVGAILFLVSFILIVIVIGCSTVSSPGGACPQDWLTTAFYIVAIGFCLGGGILAIAFWVKLRRRNNPAFQARKKIIPKEVANELKLKENLTRLAKLFQISTKVKLNDAGRILDLSREDLLAHLHQWESTLGNFRVEGEFIIVEAGNITTFIHELDEQMKAWSATERLNKELGEGKLD